MFSMFSVHLGKQNLPTNQETRGPERPEALTSLLQCYSVLSTIAQVLRK